MSKGSDVMSHHDVISRFSLEKGATVASTPDFMPQAYGGTFRVQHNDWLLVSTALFEEKQPGVCVCVCVWPIPPPLGVLGGGMKAVSSGFFLEERADCDHFAHTIAPSLEALILL